MSVEQYNDLPAQNYTKGSVFKGTRTVLAFDPDLLDTTVQLDGEQGLLLFQSRYDLNAIENEPEVSARNLLLNDSGKIVAISNNTIGYRVAFIQPDGTNEEDERGRRYQRGDDLVAPVTNAVASSAFDFNGRFGTDEKGRYRAFYYIPPCPGFSFNYSIPINVAIPYRTYNPQSKRGYGEYLFWGLSDYTCIGPPIYPSFSLLGVMSHVSTLAVYSAINNTPSQANFPIDVTLMSGRFGLYNPTENEAGTLIPVGDTTRRQARPERDPEDSEYQSPEIRDYNGDETNDHVSELGALTDEFVEDIDDEARQKLYGVWFSKPEDATEREGGLLFDAQDEPIIPDLVRVADLIPNFEPIGLLEQVSEEDLLETDLYVFRESTGELVVEKLNFARNGDLAETPRNGVDEQSSLGYFELTVPGRDAGHSFRNVYRNRKLYNDYEDWQASLGIQASLQGYESDSLRVGEPLTLVVLNRATGYIGTASTSVVDVSERSINISLPDIRLLPPNLQVQVDRQYQVEKGLTAGESRHYRVGSEGAALTSDQFVSIHTQWLNHDGTALPSELPNPALSSTAAHQYLHVVAREKNAMPESPDFGAGGDSEFPSRPTRFVPVKMAIYDEEASMELQKTQQALELEGVKQNSSVYRWVYRPEMQYSVHELDITSIARTVDEETIEILVRRQLSWPAWRL